MKFNVKTENTTKTINLEGRQAYSLRPKTELVQRVSTWFVNEPKFYGNIDVENQDILILIKDVAKEDPEFILKLAVYCREKLFLRTAPVVILVEASLIDSCKQYVRKYTPRIITRSDQLSESISYLQHRIGHIGRMQNKGSMPAALKRGIADTIINFSEYSLSKYNRDADTKFRDVLNLVHPKPKNEEQSRLFKSLLDGTIKSAETWETIISTQGSTKENWEDAISKMGYMAKLRNLSNFLKHDCDLEKVTLAIENPELIKRSRQYPFRFLAAYNKVQQIANSKSSSLLASISRALDISIDNIPDVKGVTFVAVDHSPSMSDTLSEKNELTRIAAANTFASIINKRWENVIVDVFSTAHTIVNLNPDAPTLSNIESLVGKVESWGTNLGISVRYLRENKIFTDRIIYLTDEVSNGEYDLASEVSGYRQEVNPNVYVYVMNLAGYGTSGLSDTEQRTCRFSGFNEKILDYIAKFEQETDNQVKEIENYASNIRQDRR